MSAVISLAHRIYLTSSGVSYGIKKTGKIMGNKSYLVATI